jgi:hypothetical protein
MRSFMPLMSARPVKSFAEKMARMPVMPQPNPIVPVSCGSTSNSLIAAGWRTNFATDGVERTM